MKIKNKLFSKTKYRFGNLGSALVTVIVVIAFMSILATTVLYLAGENYKTKIYDLKTKESFYEAEEILELFRASLIRDVAECSKPAYDAVMTNYAKSGDKNTRATEYLTQFKIQFDTKIQDDLGVSDPDSNPAITTDSVIGAFIPIAVENDDEDSEWAYKININGNDLIFNVEIPGYYKDFFTSVPEGKVFNETDKKAESYIINDVKIKVQDENTNYYSEITTSFMITPPQLNWGEDIDNDNDEINFSECVRFMNYVKE